MTSEPKPRLMLIGHTYSVEVNREKALHLANHFIVKVCTMDLEGWNVFGSESIDISTAAHESAYELRRLRRWPAWQDHTKIFLKGLKQEMAEFRPDVILVENEPWSFMRWQARLAAWLTCPKAKFAEFSWENVRRSKLKGFVINLFYKAAAATTDMVVCGNRAAAKLFLDAGLDRERLHIDGQLGVSEADFPIASLEEKQNWRQSQGWEVNDLVMGFCGRLVEEKGILELAQAVLRLRDDFPNLRLAILGSGSLQAELAQMDLSGSWLRILPPVPHHEVYAFLNKLDVFVLPSKPLNQKGRVWEEQFGHVLIEAITSGTLTIGSNSGAIPEVLNDERMIFQHSSSEAIVDIFRRIFQDSTQHDLLAKEQRSACLAHWNHAELARRYAGVLLRRSEQIR